MNTSILQKCVEELKKDSPKIDYILGMLETVIEMSGQPAAVTYSQPAFTNIMGTMPVQTTNVPGVLSDEEMRAEKYAGGPIGGLH